VSSNRGLVTLISLVLLGLGSGFGALAGSVVVGLLVGAGFILVWLGCGAVEIRAYGRAWFAIGAGVVSTVDAMWLGDMAGRWLWLPALLVMGVAIAVAGSSAWNDSRRHGEALVALGILVMVFAVLAPIVVYPSLAGPTEAAGGGSGAFSAADGLSAVGGALREAATSLWGWIDLAALVLIGLASWRRAGAELAPALAVAAVFIAGGVSAGAGETVAAAAGASPASWLKDLLLASDEHLGSAGWGVLALSAGVVLASLPVLRKLVVMNQVAVAASRAEGSDAVAVARFVTLEGYGTGWSSVIVLAYEILYIGTAAMLWVGLRWAAGDASALPFDVIRIPDLAVPSFRPVWEVSYFSLAVILGASAVLTGRVFARISVSKRVPVFTSPVWQMGIAILAAFVAPAGVLLYGIGITWLQTGAVLSPGKPARLLHDERYATGVSGTLGTNVIMPSSGSEPSAKTTGAGAGTATGDSAATAAGGGSPASGSPGAEGEGSGAMGGGFDDKPIWERNDADERPIWAEADAPGGDTGDGGAAGGAAAAGEPSPPAVTPLFDAGPLVDIARIGEDDYVVLSEEGDITLFRRGSAVCDKRVAVVRPLGLGPIPQCRAAFVDGGGRVLDLSFSDETDDDDRGIAAVRVQHSGVIEEATCFAVSPSGALVVTGGGEKAQVTGFFLTSEIARVLFKGVEPATALGFSPDGRVLAVGSASGDVHLVDVGGQGVVAVLSAGRASGRGVVAVTGAPDDSWLVASDDERVAVWRGGEPLRSVDAGGEITALTADGDAGTVAVGTAFGLVRVLGADLGTQLAQERPFAAEVRRIVWVDDAVVCAAVDGRIRRIRLK